MYYNTIVESATFLILFNAISALLLSGYSVLIMFLSLILLVVVFIYKWKKKCTGLVLNLFNTIKNLIFILNLIYKV